MQDEPHYVLLSSVVACNSPSREIWAYHRFLACTLLPRIRVHAPVHVAEAQVHAPRVNQNFHFLSKKKKTVCYVYKCMHL